jgi:membrane protein DedA with SNARE-associated domain
MDVHEIIHSFSYVAIFILMITNGVINLPSSQLLYLVVGYFVSTGYLDFITAVLVGAIGNTIGNILIFLVVKKYGKPIAQKILFMDETTFGAIYGSLHATFSKRGMWYIFLGKIIPSIKAFIPILAGLAKTKNSQTFVLFFLSSCIWAMGIVMLGKIFGEHVSLTSLAGISFVVGVTILFLVYKNVHKALAKTSKK